MAVTITDLRTILSECDATTGWTGSNTVSVFTTEPTPIETTGCLGMVVSNATQNAYFTTTAINFTASPSLIYLWIFHRAELDTRANGGLMIQLGDGTNRVGYHVAGSDVDGFRHSTGPVGWQCLVLDTANRPTQLTTFAGVAANLNMGAITQIGVGFKTLVKAVGGVANCFWDVLRYGGVGQGLRISGGTVGSPGTWDNIADADALTGNQQAYGIVRRLGAGVYGVQGPLEFGASTGDTYFSDSNVTVVFEDRSVTDDKYSVSFLGGTGTTVFSLTNSIIQAPTAGSATLTASNTSFTTLTLTNTQMVRFKNGVTFSSATNGTSHSIDGCVFRNCTQVSLGVVPTTNTIFTGYTPTTDAALLWNASIDIESCDFVDNTRGIEHTTAGTFTYTTLLFSGNTYDIVNTSGGLVTINAAAGANPTSSINDVGGGSVVINNVKNLVITNIQPDSEVRIYNASNTTIEYAGSESVTGELIGATLISGGTGYTLNDILTLSGGTFTVASQVQATAVSSGVITAVTVLTPGTYTVAPVNPTSVTGGTGTGAQLLSTIRGTFTYSYNYTGDIPIRIIVFHLNFKEVFLTGQKLLGTDQSIPVQQIVDRVRYNP